MANINPSLPVVGGPRGDGEVLTRNALIALLAELNGNLDSSNLKDASIQAADLAPGVIVGASQQPTRSILDTGVVGHTRAGRQLAVTDFTTLLGLSQPAGLFNLSDLTNLGTGGALSNKGAVTFAKGVTGAAAEAAQFIGSTGQALYIADTGAADPFRIKTGSWGCWFRTAKRGTAQTVISKLAATAGQRVFSLAVTGANVGEIRTYSDGSTQFSVTGVTDLADDRWHFIVAVHDGSVTRLFVDGALESSTTNPSTLFAGSSALNIGGYGADGATATGEPHYGRIDEAFVTADVLNEDQIRLLMAVKIAHGLTATPQVARVGIRRRKRGGALAASDFSVTPKVLYNFTNGSLADVGSLGTTLSATGGPVAVAGADGAKDGAIHFNGSSQYLSASDTGLPTGTASRTVGCWWKSTPSGVQVLLQYGVLANQIQVYQEAGPGGAIRFFDGLNDILGPGVGDGQWHLLAWTIDNAAADGVKQKMYLDGRLIAALTAFNSTTLAGAGGLRIGSRNDNTQYWRGSADGLFITDYAMAQDEISSLFAKGNLPLGVAPTLDMSAGEEIVQGFDATNLYVLGDVRKRISGRVNSDGTIAEAVGGDFRVVKTGGGTYTIYFPPGTFSAPPVATFTVHTAANHGIQITGATANSLSVQIYTSTGTNTITDSPFDFTAEGRGPIPSQDQIDIGIAP